MNQLVQLLIRWRWPLLALAAVLAVVSWPAASELRFDQSIENMFAPDDPLLEPYQRFKGTFGEQEVVLAAYVDPELLTPAGMDRLAEVTARLGQVDGVALTQSLADPLLRAVALSDTQLGDSLLNVFEGYMLGSDRQTAAVVCLMEAVSPDGETAGSTPRTHTIDKLREVIGSIPDLPPGVLAGEPVMLVDGFRYLEQDGRILGWTSTLLLTVVMLVCFRSIRWVIVPIAVVQLTLLLTKATLVWSGFELSMVSSMLSAIVTTIGVATVVHLIVGFLTQRQLGRSPRDSLLLAGAMLGWPIVGACVTDALGFGSLLLASVGPIQDFGIMMALSAIVVLGVVAIAVPGLVLAANRTTPTSSHRNAATGERGLNASLMHSARSIHRRPKVWAVSVTIVSVAAAIGCINLEVETDFTKNFRASSPVVESYQFVESRLGGAGVWDIVLPAPENLNWDYLVRVRNLQDRLRSEVLVEEATGQSRPGISKVLSLVDIVEGTVGQAENTLGGQVILGVQLAKLRQSMPELISTLHRPAKDNSGEYVYRIMLRSLERQTSQQKKSTIEQVRRICQEEFRGSEVTGYFVLLTYLIDSMIDDQWTTFGAASLAIWLMMLIAFRSIRLSLIALIPNALPIFMVTGLIGWLNLKINMGTAMIAAVSMGLSVDSSIHYLAALHRRRREGLPLREALEQVQQTVGRAMVFSTLALAIGFCALCYSNFIPTVYFGALVSLAMLGGLLGNLIILPMLLTVTEANENIASSSA